MQQRIKTLLKDNIFFIAIGITFSIGYLSLVKMGPQPISFTYLDKVEHTLAYFFLAISWFYTLSTKYLNLKGKSLIVAGCIFYGIILEVLQGTITSYRTADSFDIVANATGVLFALLIFNQVSKKNKII